MKCNRNCVQRQMGKHSIWAVILLSLCSAAFVATAAVTPPATSTPAATTKTTKAPNTESNSVGVAAHLGKYPKYPTINYGTGAHAALIKRGEYLAKVGDCLACHTQDSGGTPFAGGLAIKTPFGTIYTPNITPDKQTGIGHWTDKDFIRALRKGINPKGKYYYPAFPYLYFSKLTEQDILAIKAYLDALKPVHKVNKKDTMMFPFNWRFLQLGWRILFFYHHDKTFKPDPKQSAAVNRGAYLVKGLGHCAMCHTRSYHLISRKYSLGAPIRKYGLAGNFVQGFYAPDITHRAFAKTPVSKITDVFLKGKLVEGGQVQGPMAEVNHDSLQYLTIADLDNIAEYLKSVHSELPPHPKQINKVSLKVGKKVYDTYCAGCHGTGAGGAPKFGNVQDWAPKIKLGMNQLYKNAIAGIGGMPPKGTCSTCNSAEIQSAVEYMVINSEPGHAVSGALGHRKLGKAPQKPTIALGKRIYDQHCSVCHSGVAASQVNAPELGNKTAWAPLIKHGMVTLFEHAIKGYKGHPKLGACYNCSDTEVIAAVKYMVEQSKTSGNYTLW